MSVYTTGFTDKDDNVSQPADPGDPVSVTIRKDPDKVSANPAAGISIGDMVTIFMEEVGKELGSSTEFAAMPPSPMPPHGSQVPRVARGGT